ncbi:MAG: IS3 family transposase [Pseudonocardiaceae bacterium]
MKFAAIADWADSENFPVEFMCRELGVSRSGYYAWRGRAPSDREQADASLLTVIKHVYERLRGNPGVRRIHAELVTLGHRVAPKRVWRLMRDAGLQGRHPKPWKRTTVAGQAPVPAPDLIGRDFTAEAVNQRWCGSGSPGEFHPRAPTVPGVTVSRHRALVALITRTRGSIANERTSGDTGK